MTEGKDSKFLIWWIRVGSCVAKKRITKIVANKITAHDRQTKHTNLVDLFVEVADVDRLVGVDGGGGGCHFVLCYVDVCAVFLPGLS